MTRKRLLLGLLAGFLIPPLGSGCGGPQESIPPRRPRPVVVRQLRRQAPPQSARVAASVASWKTEQIGFEVSGRVEFVIEPNTEVDGRVRDKEGTLVVEGSPIARLESERYRLQAARAKADVTRAERALEAAQTELDESIPARSAAAEAARALAKAEYERSLSLFRQNAGSRGDVDRDKANYQNALSQIKQLDAAKKSQEAQVESLRNGVLQAEQNQRDAERNIEDCTLFSSFAGQIADVSVVPGSVVSPGQPVATIQMMNPIKVELEVSPYESRRLQRAERLPVEITMPDGSSETREGFLYRVDPVADPATRTFTVTLLVLNEKLATAENDRTVAATRDLWRLNFPFLPGAGEGRLFVPETALLQDADGYYLWQVTNVTIDMPPAVQRSRMLKVRKLRVEPQQRKAPFLGNWVFQQVTIQDEAFDPNIHMVVGELTVADGEPRDWNGDTVVLDSGGQWLLRPGDVVEVNLTPGNGDNGYYVPMNAIVRDDGAQYLVTVVSESDKTVARRVPVRLVEAGEGANVSSLCRVEADSESGELEGLPYVVEGAHYLVDGETVSVLTGESDQP